MRNTTLLRWCEKVFFYKMLRECLSINVSVQMERLNEAQNAQTQASEMHIHGRPAPHANQDLHTVMNSFDLRIHIFDSASRCQINLT